MNIYVCVKQVPDTEARVQVAGDGQSIEKSDMNTILNPFERVRGGTGPAHSRAARAAR